ncbi:MAG: alanine dehydrogenase [Bacteroidales bacterium]|jgi:alanine dehydrogenase|nr:alanine dehydrogenase [Bacteroidales bacterium]
MPTVYFSIDKQSFMPREELLRTDEGRRSLLIGIPKEASPHENRIVLTPETVGVLVRHGHHVLIESLAGEECNYSDLQYGEMGGYIVGREEVYRSDVLLKIDPPTSEEIDLMKERQLLFSFLPPFLLSGAYVRKLMDKHVTAVSFDTIRDRFGCYPLVRMMSEIAGSASIQIAAEYLNKSTGGKGILLGGISGVNPAEVVIIGAGTAAEFAVRSALGMGAFVRVFDNSVHRLQRLQNNLGQRLYTSVMHPQAMQRALASADALIGAAYMDGTQSGYPITEEMVATMKQGAVIVDLSINQGGCCETSEIRDLQHPVTVKYGVVHYGVPNITSLVPRTASMAISNIVSGIILDMETHGSMSGWLKSNSGIRNGVYIFNGTLTEANIGELFGIPYQDIHLLMAAF